MRWLAAIVPYGFAVLLACGPQIISPTLAADEFPVRPITIVVPYPPGGGSDPPMRLIAQKAAQELKPPVIIDNRPGGAGNVGAVAVKQATPDGYTLFMGHVGTHAINPALFPDLKFDPLKDFAPITELFSFPPILVVPARSPAHSVAELAALVKANPGRLTYASQGIGAGGHLMGEMFKVRLGTSIIHVPYRGAAPAVTDLVAGRVDMMFASYFAAGPHIEAATLRVLAVASDKRMDIIPNTPTMAEVGFPGLELNVWFGLLAPAGTPQTIVETLNRAFVKAAHEPEVAKFIASQVAEVKTGTPAEFAALVSTDTERLGAVIRAAGVKAE
jgi:tripartite-type tricarboxylate transporter receptor subunit TctC